MSYSTGPSLILMRLYCQTWRSRSASTNEERPRGSRRIGVDMTTTIPSRLSDGELVAEVARLAGSEREASASLVAYLAELYGRRLHERAAYGSLFTFCTDVLRLSEHEAYDRMRAAKVARRFPAVLGLLASGRVNLTTVRLLAPHLTRQNHEELLAAACGKRKRQVQELLAARFPQPDVACSIRKLPTPRNAPMSEATSGVTSSTSPTAEPVTAVAVPSSGSSGPSPIPPRPHRSSSRCRRTAIGSRSRRA